MSVQEVKTKSSLTNLRRKTVVGLLRAWRDVKSTARVKITGEVRPSLPKEDIERILKQMRECLSPKGGEITARARTVELGRTYLSLNDAGRARFFKLLASEFAVDRPMLDDKLRAAMQATSSEKRLEAEQALRDALVPPRYSILRQFNALPDGFKFLVDLREDLLPAMGEDAELKALEYDVKQVLSSWFDIGLLDLVQLSWNSPAAVLEKLIEYEAVHVIRSWDDLKNRLDSDRRIFAFFHNKMSDEPLIFVQVALVKGMADSIQHLLDENVPVTEPSAADSAIFYSISNAQRGLNGISFGNFLIKRVVDRLSQELPQIKTFATLSPIPGFKNWLDAALNKQKDALFTDAERKELKKLGGSDGLAKTFTDQLRGNWQEDPERAGRLKPTLMRLCAHYLVNEKRSGRALDPVAHFHLTNGARMERLNWLADTSPKGMKQSLGLMVNYNYILSDIDENHEAYVSEGQVMVSRGIKTWL